ncbi:MAG: ABC transporter ATP-binding protein [Nocardioidaceae bacterium]
MTTPAISVQGVTKRYTKYEDEPMLLSSLRLRSRTRRSVLDAVSGLDLTIGAGESVGVLGRNGAGKSTLMQMLCGVTAPTTGRVAVRGRVAPLISVGVGFHPELTGRENVYVNGTVLGMSRSEIDRRFDEVVAFAELEQFIDTPVKFYSSGMFVRLGFSVAVAADPDVLLVDEVLAVGDFAFQMKCFARMEEIRARGTTIVLISHNVGAIRGLCERGVVLQRGTKVYDGPVHDAVSAYYASVGQHPDDAAAPGDEQAAAVVEELALVGPDGTPTAHLESGSDAVVRVRVRARRAVARPCLVLTVTSESGGPVYTDTNAYSPFDALAAGESAVYDVGVRMALAKGGFTVLGSLHDALPEGGTQVLDRARPLSFYVGGRGLVSGLVDLGGRFEQQPSHPGGEGRRASLGGQ